MTALEHHDAEQHQIIDALRQQEEIIRQMAASLHEVVWLRDVKTLKILYVNPAYEKLWGCPCQSLYDAPTSFLNYVHPDDKQRVMQAIERQRSGVLFNQEYRIIRPDGTMRWVWGQTFPIYNEQGELYRIAALAQDITRRKEAEEERERFIAALDDFDHTVAHDLKNPLSIVIGYCSLLADDYELLPPEEIKQAIHAIAQSSNKMITIIDNLLLLASVRKMQDVTISRIDMGSIVLEALNRLSNLIVESQAQIIEPDDWPAAFGLAPWIEEVWVNYISNAIKYGGKPPMITLGATEQPDSMVRFWVRDNGLGLTADAQAKLFTPFTRMHTRNFEGHGLGLSIVRLIMDKLGGQVGVDSAGIPGQGCTFYFTLPHASH
ncbi:MAG: PAS domain-containing protein [Anaerolineae bacterium]|nr:PAS domain-containing protein [Anaerolineae bacterium]